MKDNAGLVEEGIIVKKGCYRRIAREHLADLRSSLQTSWSTCPPPLMSLPRPRLKLVLVLSLRARTYVERQYRIPSPVFWWQALLTRIMGYRSSSSGVESPCSSVTVPRMKSTRPTRSKLPPFVIPRPMRNVCRTPSGLSCLVCE